MIKVCGRDSISFLKSFKTFNLILYDPIILSNPNISLLERSLIEVALECLYLAHEEDGVEYDKKHDKVLEGRGCDKPPDLISYPSLALRDIHLLGLSLYNIGDAGFLKVEKLKRKT